MPFNEHLSLELIIRVDGAPVREVFHILDVTQTFPLFSDDAEVQRQKMVPVLISARGGAELHGQGFHLPLAHVDSSWLAPPPPPIPSICPFILQAFFTETLGIFFPSTMLNTVLTSVLRWNWGVDRGEGQPQRKQLKWCLFYVLVCLFISVQPLFRGRQLAYAPGDSSFSFAKNVLYRFLHWAHCGQYSNPWTQLKKDKNLMKKQRLQKKSFSVKRRKKKSKYIIIYT